MIEPISNDTLRASDEQSTEERATSALLDWETPRLEDVSEQVMAQPYIRFT
jgi:hypothetical protein